MVRRSFFAIAPFCLMAAGVFFVVTDIKEPQTSTFMQTGRHHRRYLQQMPMAEVPMAESLVLAPEAEMSAPAAEDEASIETIFAYIRNNETEALEELFASGQSTDIYSANGVTPLIAAIRMGRTEIVDSILEKGVDTNLPEVPSGMTALMAAIEARDVDLVERLIAAGADINFENSEGDNALFYAINLKPPSPEIVRILAIQKPTANTSAPNFEATNADGLTPYEAALETGNRKLIDIAEEYMMPVGMAPAPEEEDSVIAALTGMMPSESMAAAPAGEE